MADWNWYFAALAQSAAAIVGIFGAFIITKILSNQAAFSEKLNRSKETNTACLKLVERASDLPFNWYSTRIAEDQIEDMQYLLDNDDSLTPEILYTQLAFSKCQDRNEAIDAIRNAVDDRLERLEKERTELKPNGLLGNLEFNPPNLVNPHLVNEVQRVGDSIESVFRESKHQIRVVKDFLDTIRGNPESSTQITGTLILVTILFFAGVIYPLSFLPVPANSYLSLSLEAFWPLITSLKGVLLSVVSVVFTGILLMFFRLNLKLKYSAETVTDLEGFTELSAYSKYFEIMERHTSGIMSLPKS